MNLVFHLVVKEIDLSKGSPNLSTTVADLSESLERLRSSGRVPRPLSDYLGPEQPGPGSFTVSFDDAHPSLLELAVPVLAELEVPATVFVPTDHVGQTPRVMDWRAIEELAAFPGWTIGSHGAAHVRMSWHLYEESTLAHYERLFDSARRSRAVIAERLGSAPTLFAYPFGEAPEPAREAVRRSGYKAAFTVAPSPDWDGDMMGIPRQDGVQAVTGRDIGHELEQSPPGISVIVPASDRIEILGEVVQRLADQSYPEEQSEIVVVDDGSRVSLRSALSEQLSQRVRVIELEGSDATFRAGQARQAGAEAARYDVFAFLDADIAVDRDFLWHLAYCHTLDANSVVLGYLSGYNLHDLGFVHYLDEIRATERLTGDLLAVIPDRSREPALRHCLDDIQGLDEPWRLAYTGNLSVSRSLLDRAGGFSSGFHGWGFEDVDLGVRLHDAGARWIFSRWALGYHIADEQEVRHSNAPRNPFRDPEPDRDRFDAALENLATLEGLHPDHTGVTGFCDQVRADVEEICDPPDVVGIEVGADTPVDWPFLQRLHKAWPGGLSSEEILERLAYAHKLGARSIYLLGGDVALRKELPRILDVARDLGVEDVTIETTGIPFARPGAAEELVGSGLSAAVIEILAGLGHPRRLDEVRDGVAALRDAGVRLGSKVVLGHDDRESLTRALAWVDTLELPLFSVVLLARDAEDWVRREVGTDVEVELVTPRS